ncbi:MAG: hypothetical protein KatS3mg042_1390 [Rhodothermaceae bacterium]|nr:MAG: hypothetical protein KatS3mg042_1390 [Rhodothermaceae bacterium]
MMSNATTRLLACLVLTSLFGLSHLYAQEAQPLGDDFIFFVNGVNTLVPSFDGQVVTDPLEPTNKVMKNEYGNWSFQAFRWDPAVGVDMSANRADGDVLHLKLLVDPANAGMPGLSIMFEDKTDGSGADDGSADLPFRLLWQIPEDLRDGQWHDLTIPLPPATWQELEDAKTAGTLDPLAENWVYGGAWSTGGFGVALDFMGPNTSENPHLWKEFEWTNVGAVGIFWDNNTGGGPIWVDDVYIGAPGLDLSIANDPASPMSGVTFAAGGEANVISWTHNPEFGGYNVYVAESPITDVTAEGVQLLTTVTADAETTGMLSVEHRLEVPHESLAPLTVYYAVTSLSNFGVENPDVSASAGSIANPDLPVQPIIVQLTEDEGNMLFDNLSAGVVSNEGFPDGYQPFVLDSNHSQLSESLTLPDSDEDNSGMFWMGYTDLNELWIYAEVRDDVIELAGESTPPNDAWQFDSIELGWGNYDVRDVPGGSIIFGSPHQEMERGQFADYQFRISAHVNAASEVTVTHAFVGWSIDADAQGGGAAYDILTDEGGNPIGYKMLALFPLDAIQNVDQGDAVLPPPASNELRLVPMTITLNDADGSTREHQITWSLKPNVDNQWWNTPAQWATVAMVGRDLFVPTAIETIDDTVPERFTLEQNYPNPFNPSTTIRFALTKPEAVRLKVFDLLGREVATLIDGQMLPAGTHAVDFRATNLASGQYLYRLEAGSFVQTRKMTLLK